ncbi:zinc ABC transporter substrate-binding protein [Alphaproteobacteria bacterium]|jgi:zinc/manganese transport system substrate-binding protein|nr:zinc ABC transporter substrate-binding protein [Alphaproteobacteria bacterium]
MRPLLLPLLALLLTTGSLSAADPIKATASFSILADIVERVGGDRVVVSSIVGPDSDAHTYSPTVGDARSVAKADIVFINGLGFEGWIGDLIAASGNDAPVITVTRDIEPLLIDGEADPHAWNDLTNGVAYAAAIKEGLSALDPDNAAVYAANQHAFAKEINELLARVQPRFAALPQNQRSVVTAHDAFGYFEAQFGLRFLAPVGMNTDAEPSARGLAQLIRQIKAEDIGGLFVENITNPDLVAQIAEETGLDIGGRLYSDALSAQGGPATSYLAMMHHNIATLLSTLSRP